MGLQTSPRKISGRSSVLGDIMKVVPTIPSDSARHGGPHEGRCTAPHPGVPGMFLYCLTSPPSPGPVTALGKGAQAQHQEEDYSIMFVSSLEERGGGVLV